MAGRNGRTAVPLIFVLLSLPILSHAQSALQQPTVSLTFDVATIRPSKPGAAGSTYSFSPGQGVKVANGTVKGLIEMAYDVRDFQIQDGPGWTDSETFDIVAKSAATPDSGTGSSAKNIEETRVRLQALLAERFQLKIRRESRELPEYILTAGKSGPKLKANAAGSSTAGINASCEQMIGTNTTMANLAYKLSRTLDRSVVDQTKLSGNFDFVLKWTPDTGPCAASPSVPDSAATSSGDGPSIFTAIQEQLGLKLESAKGPVETVVIDHVERPSPN